MELDWAKLISAGCACRWGLLAGRLWFCPLRALILQPAGPACWSAARSESEVGMHAASCSLASGPASRCSHGLLWTKARTGPGWTLGREEDTVS